jgi:tetratricopeptide (TPR) repeat protein
MHRLGRFAAAFPAAIRFAIRRHGALIAIALVALALRLLYLHQIAALPFFDAPVGESEAHLNLARDIASGTLLPSRPFFYASVLYPYFLAAVLAMGGNLFVVCLLQGLAGVLLVVLLASLSTRLFGRTAGLATGVLAALYGPFAFLEADVLGIVWALVGLAVAMNLAVRWEDEQADRRGMPLSLVLAGLAMGGAAAERPNLVLMIPLLAAWCAWRARRARAIPAAAVAVGAAFPILVVVLLNLAASGQWIPLATSRGLNFSMGFHPGATGTYDEPWADRAPQFNAQHTDLEESSVRMASMLSGRALTPEGASDFWTAQAMDYIRTHPREAAWLTVRKAALLLNAAEIPNHLNYSFIRQRASALWAMPLDFGVVAALATLGLGFAWFGRRRRAGALLLVLVSATVAGSVLPFFVTDRYRAPMVPSLLVLAGMGVAALASVVRRPDPSSSRRVAALLAAAACVAVLSHVPLVRPILSRDHWMMAQAYDRRGNLPAAAAAYEEAVREGGDDGELLNNLALVYRRQGMGARAEATLRKAIAANRQLANPHKNLAMLLIGRGDFAAALSELREAVRLEPEDAEALGAMGALLAERGATAEAAATFARARELAPHDARLARLIASYPGVAQGGAAPSP